MKYEEFEARAKSAFDDCSEMKRMLWNMQTVVGAVPDMVRKNERLEKKNAELKQENAALNAELDDWKGNAEGFEPDAYMKLPLDADGEPIHIGDVLYSSGNKFRVVNITVKANEVCVAVYADDGTFFPWANPKYLSRNSTEPLEPEPADSWEKLLGDLDRAANGMTDGAECRYADNAGRTCKTCKFDESTECTGYIFADIARRIRALREVR